MTHQTGTNDLERVRTAYRENGFDGAEVAAYFPGMAACFGRADLIVSRAGATTLAEIIAARRAALLVPFAGASEDHQSANARELEAAGAAEVLPEDKATPETLAARILSYLGHSGELEAMERNLARLQSPSPAGRIAELCLSLMKPAPKETAS